MAIKGQEYVTEMTVKGLNNSYNHTCIEVSLHTLACSDHGTLDHNEAAIQ